MTDDPMVLPSMHDVAVRAGVSHKTVWRVINDPDSVRGVTRDRVIGAIDELGYRRNLTARRLVTQRSGMIGIVASPDINYGPTRALYAVELATRKIGYQPLIASADPHDPGQALDVLLAHAVEAVLVLTTDTRTIRAFDHLPGSIPVLHPAAVQQIDGAPFRLFDESTAIEEIAQHLHDLGHRVVQQIAGPSAFLGADERRLDLDRALRSRGMDVKPAAHGHWSAESGYAAATSLHPDVTAVVCSNDQMAIGIIHALTAAGTRVPEDISVIGWDDIPEAAYLRPTLTTVRADTVAAAERELALARALIDGTALPPDEPVVSHIITRGSTAPAR